ncbi:protein kinase family protein [Rothia sp. ARF10]|nr:protein kinase family protein [Rothia sp. ARF10]
MEGVGPGTTLDGRYTTQRRIEQRHGCERWTADDTTLGRSVVVLCLPDSDHRASAVLDAGRRAAGLDTPTLQRVLDVGRERGVAWVVEADTSGARSLAQLVHEGGLPADEVRRIVGEVATALESARQRGLHHLDLRPEDVLRTTDGEVRLRGVATSAAIVELDDLESEDASRRDAIGVVSLAYAGLTGLWPGDGVTSLGAAPRVLGGVAAPSEIAAGVPRDLDALCRLTLGDDQGPTSPGDFARQIAPWPSRQVAGRSTIATTAPTDPRVSTSLTAAAAPPTPEPTVAASPVTGAPVAGARATGAAVAGATVAWAGDDVVADADEEPTHEIEVGEDDTPTRVIDRSTVGAPVTEVIPAPDRSADTTTLEPLRDDEQDQNQNEDQGPGPAAAAAAAAGAAMAGAGAAVAGAMSRAGSRVGTFGRQVGERAAEKAAERRGFHERITAPNAPGLTAEGERVRPGTGTDTSLEPPAPLVPAEPLTKDESKLALGIVAGFLVLALIVGIIGVMKIGSNTDLDFGGVPTKSPTTSATPSGTPSPGASASAGGGEKLQILAADGFDPQGDGRENGTRAPRVFDGNPETAWQSEGYGSAALGGLKQGVGVVVDLGPNVAARSITLTLGNTADVEVYIGADKTLSGAAKVGAKASASGNVTFPVKAGTAGQYVIVWFTKLTQDDNGRYRAVLGEVEVKN